MAPSSRAAARCRAGRLPGLVLAVLFALAMAGCDLFSTRTPESPIQEGGTYEQPDTPEQVIENLRFAVAELNPRNYRRSFADDFVFRPAPEAEARDPSLWSSWGAAQEAQAFTALAESAARTTGNGLSLQYTASFESERRVLIDGSYVLTVRHRRTELPVTVQGRLLWTLVQGEDGLWAIERWTDQMVGSASSWSDLKAAFAP